MTEENGRPRWLRPAVFLRRVQVEGGITFARATLYRWIAAGLIPSVKLHNQIYINENQLSRVISRFKECEAEGSKLGD